MALLLYLGAASAADAPLEYQVKASYLYNFMRFIDWPDDAFAADGAFNLCVSDLSRFGAALDALAGEQIDGHTIHVRSVDSPAAVRATHCHLLFVSAAKEIVWMPLAPERGLLTVGESREFTQHGGIINLLEVQGRIRFQINHPVAERAGLVISSRLLNLAMTQP
ncbi:MAG: YfiR family protein [Gammaproteobacteria bacterium]|nr:YfiR family protein [Gammaproteobacteria bacterium]